MSRITLQQLEAFFWTATLGSVDGAAQRLHLAQPTVSLRLKGLEDALGLSLFDRVGRNLRLSFDGQTLLPRARSVLDGVGEMVRHSGQEKITGRIRVGFAEGFALVCLPAILRRLHELHPELRPEFTAAISSTIEPDVRQHKLDLAFLVDPIGSEGFTMIPLGIQKTNWAASKDWQLPETVRPHDLAHLPIITNQPTSIGYRHVQAWFASAGIVPTRLDTCSSVAMLAHLVAAGVAAAILPSNMADSEALSGKVTVLKSSPPVESLHVFATYFSETQTPAIKAMIEVVREVMLELGYPTHRPNTDHNKSRPAVRP